MQLILTHIATSLLALVGAFGWLGAIPVAGDCRLQVKYLGIGGGDGGWEVDCSGDCTGYTAPNNVACRAQVTTEASGTQEWQCYCCSSDDDTATCVNITKACTAIVTRDGDGVVDASFDCEVDNPDFCATPKKCKPNALPVIVGQIKNACDCS